MGTIGGGNHFAEFQEIEKIIDQDTFLSLNLDPNEVFLLVHSGSRSYGENVLGKYMDEQKSTGDICKGSLEDSIEF